MSGVKNKDQKMGIVCAFTFFIIHILYSHSPIEYALVLLTCLIFSSPPSRSSVTEQVRVAELELTAQALRDTLREKEKEIEGTVREIRKQHADRLRWL